MVYSQRIIFRRRGKLSSQVLKRIGELEIPLGLATPTTVKSNQKDNKLPVEEVGEGDNKR
jgi:hypothetical protein